MATILPLSGTTLPKRNGGIAFRTSGNIITAASTPVPIFPWATTQNASNLVLSQVALLWSQLSPAEQGLWALLVPPAYTSPYAYFVGYNTLRLTWGYTYENAPLTPPAVYNTGFCFATSDSPSGVIQLGYFNPQLPYAGGETWLQVYVQASSLLEVYTGGSTPDKASPVNTPSGYNYALTLGPCALNANTRFDITGYIFSVLGRYPTSTCYNAATNKLYGSHLDMLIYITDQFGNFVQVPTGTGEPPEWPWYGFYTAPGFYEPGTPIPACP
jgi:hypothetical protein